MELVDFLRQTQAEVRSEIGDRLGNTDDTYPYPESVFAEVVMQHMADVGMTFEPQVCHYAAKVGNANLRLSGYAMNDDADQLDLFVSLYAGVDDVTPITDNDTKTAAEQCLRFLARCAEGRLAATMDESNDAYALTLTIQECYTNLDQIRVYVLTDRQAKAKNFKPRDIAGKTVKLEVMDIERLHRHWSEGKPRDELVVNFDEVAGGPLPCIYIPGDAAEYDYAMTVSRRKHCALCTTSTAHGSSKPTCGHSSASPVRSTRASATPSRTRRNDSWRTTTASSSSPTNSTLAPPRRRTRHPMAQRHADRQRRTNHRLHLLHEKEDARNRPRPRPRPREGHHPPHHGSAAEESLIADISKYANSQNSVKLSDLSANKPFHVQIESLALSTYCPDGIGRWFYERAAGSYNTMLAREGTTPARLRQLRDAIPTSRKITKTDLAKFLNTWAQKPDAVSFGAQKNFERFMAELTEQNPSLPDVPWYKQLIAKAILFKKTQSLVRPRFQAFQANVTTYVVALIANRLGAQLDLEKIWQRQDLSPELCEQITTWAGDVNRVLHESAAGRMISEWAKKAECWDAVRTATYPASLESIPERRLP